MEDVEMTICECTEAISELTQDEAIDEILTYIEVKARHMMEKLEERKREAERQKVRDSKVLQIVNGLGGCGAKDEYTKGWDDAINAVFNELSKIGFEWEKQNDER